MGKIVSSRGVEVDRKEEGGRRCGKGCASVLVLKQVYDLNFYDVANAFFYTLTLTCDAKQR